MQLKIYTIERIVLIGGPSTGKTTLLNALAKRGHRVFEEISRRVILEAQKKGIEQLFITEPLLFSQKLLEGRIKQFNAAAKMQTDFVLYDRGLPDVLAYMDHGRQNYPPEFITACENHRYDRVFVLPPWEEIHEVDNERYEDFELAQALHKVLLKTYQTFDYSPILVPKCSVSERVIFMENHLSS